MAMVEMKPMKRLKHIIATKAVLGTLKMKEPGYMSGMIDQLKQSSRYMSGMIDQLKQSSRYMSRMIDQLKLNLPKRKSV